MQGDDVGTETGHLTLGLAAVRIGGGVQHHHLRRLARRGAIPHQRAGRLHLVAVADLPRIRAACVAAGYLEPGAAGAAGA
jgi:hypothetical protein